MYADITIYIVSVCALAEGGDGAGEGEGVAVKGLPLSNWILTVLILASKNKTLKEEWIAFICREVLNVSILHIEKIYSCSAMWFDFFLNL